MSPSHPAPAAIRPAVPAEAGALADLLAAAFQDDPVSGWLFPSGVDRARVQPGFFRVFVDLTLEHGEAYTTGDRTGVALWLPMAAGDTRTEEERAGLLAAFRPVLGDEYLERFRLLDDLMTANHPTHRSHHYLPFLAVAPDRQRTGIGAALLTDRFADLDRRGVPSYLEASSPRNRVLYERFGYRPLGTTIQPPDGPAICPMWRDPV